MYYTFEEFQHTMAGKKVHDHCINFGKTRNLDDSVPKNTFTALGLVASPFNNPMIFVVSPNLASRAESVLLQLAVWFHDHPECDAEAFEAIKKYVDNPEGYN